MSKGRVLVIDDDEWVCRLLSVAMNEAGFEVKITENAAEGFYRAVEDQPDCIVCDVDLPDQNGYWVARKIRSHPTKVALVPIVFLSGLDDREHRLEGFQVGGDAYLTKPFRIDEVVAQVDALIQMAARLRAARQTLASVPPTGHAMVGNLAQMSVATVLTLLDLERRSGKLDVSSSEDRSATFIVHAGNMADTMIGQQHVAPIDAFRTVMAWETGKFAFTPAPSGGETPSGDMISINAVLMEAARLEDEERASEPTASERPSSARMAWRETVLRTNAPPRESVPPSSMQSVESYMPPPPSDAPISQNETVVPGMGSDFPTGPHIEPLAAPPMPPPAAAWPTPLPAAGAPPPARLEPRPAPRIEPAIPPAPRVETPAVALTPPSPTFGSPPIPPPPPSSLKPLLPPDGIKRSMTPSPRPAISLPKPPITPTTTGSSPQPPGMSPRPPGPVTRPTKPSMPIPKTAFGAPMRSLSPAKVKAVVPPPPPSRPPVEVKEPAKETSPPSSDLVESGWSVPPPAPDDTAKDGSAATSPQAKPEAPRAAPLPPRPQRAGQGGGEG